MKRYEVSKKDSNLSMKFNSYEEAVVFCNSFIALENARNADFPELSINEIKD